MDTKPLNKNIVNVIIIMLLLIGGICFISQKSNKVSLSNNVEKSTLPSFKNYSEELGNSVINCEFKVTSTFVFKEEEKSKVSKVFYSSGEESSVINIIFAGLDTDSPIIKTNNGEDPLKILLNNQSEMTLASSNITGDIFVYKIYKEKKIATWYKSYDLLGMPFALLSMGYCY